MPMPSIDRHGRSVQSGFGRGVFLPSFVMAHSVTEVWKAGYDSQEETSRAVTFTSYVTEVFPTFFRVTVKVSTAPSFTLCVKDAASMALVTKCAHG